MPRIGLTQVEPQLEPREDQPINPALGDGPGFPMVPRAGQWGDQIIGSVVPALYVPALEGKYFVGTNVSGIDAGVNDAPNSGFTSTRALFVIKNNDVSPGKNIFFDYIRLFMMTPLPTGGTLLNFLFELDTTKRTGTGGDKFTVSGSIAQIQAWNATVSTIPPNSNTSKKVGRVSIPTTPVVGNEYLIRFGGVDFSGASYPATAAQSGQPSSCLATAPPIVIGPQQWLVVYRWSPGETGGPTFEYELAWWER